MVGILSGDFNLEEDPEGMCSASSAVTFSTTSHSVVTDCAFLCYALAVFAAMEAAMIASQADSRTLHKTRAQAASGRVVPAQAHAALSPRPRSDGGGA